MKKRNSVIRQHAKARGVRLWEVADGFGMSDTNFSRMLRKELSAEDRAKALALIDRIAEEHQGEV